jgi:hypothetical protein
VCQPEYGTDKSGRRRENEDETLRGRPDSPRERRRPH